MKIAFNLNKFNQQRQHEQAVWIYPVKLAMYATHLRNLGHEIIWDKDVPADKVIKYESQIDIPFFLLPHADRVLTDAKNKKWQNNGNFKHLPGTYIQSSNLCWYRQCSFCVESKSEEKYYLRPVEDVVSEIDECHAQGFREIFDDSGTFPIGQWLGRFCAKMSLKNYKIKLGCNMRLVDEDFVGMKHAGFRMILIGVESANQTTLDRLNKGVKADDIIKIFKKASEAGLEPHACFISSYPWETQAEENNTIKLAHYLLRKGYAKTAQASLYRTPDESATTDRGLRHNLYKVARSPEFWINKIKDLRTWEDVAYLGKGIRKGLNV